MDRRELLKRTAMLMGGVVSGSLSRAVLAGDNARAPAKPFFSPTQRSQVDIAVELIIPTTDTPGALAAGVPDFVEMIVSEYYTPTERDIFLVGLTELDKHCQTAGANNFAAASAEQQTAALLAAESAGQGHPGAGPAAAFSKEVDETTPFFAKLKELTVTGYYTSRVGATEELKYNPMPMRFDGNFPFEKVGRQWSY